MYRVWFEDLQKAVIIFRARTGHDLFCSVSGNAYGDFVFKINEDTTYIVKHTDFSVWENCGDWRNPEWKEIKKNVK